MVVDAIGITSISKRLYLGSFFGIFNFTPPPPSHDEKKTSRVSQKKGSTRIIAQNTRRHNCVFVE